MKRLILNLALLGMSACDKSRGMEIKTYELSRLSHDDAMSLLTPYIREGGRLSGSGRLITVREAPDRIRMIDDILKKYDGGGAAVDVGLDIQVIEADGFATRDSALAYIEPTLRETFKYQGYKLVGETHVQTREDGVFRQRLPDFSVSGRVLRVRTEGSEQRVPLEIEMETKANMLSSNVTATIGKPLVLGQSTSKGAVILVIRSTVNN
jgi:hypothetical protein